ncbi:unnamed protein product [Effrenium voratum]|nr:unnamed protein product [Effrenium voratum]
MSQKHTGTMSVVPAFMGFAGCSVRVLTSILQTPDDLVAILNPLTAAVMWLVLLTQFVVYYEATKKVQQEDVLWAQRPDGVYLTIDLNEAQDIKVSLDAEKLTFSGKAHGNCYEFDMVFFAPIVKEESKWSTKRLIEFYLKKEKEGTWTNLSKKKLPWVKVDWKRWQDSDDEAEEGKKDAWNLDGAWAGSWGTPVFGVAAVLAFLAVSVLMHR